MLHGREPLISPYGPVIEKLATSISWFFSVVRRYGPWKARSRRWASSELHASPIAASRFVETHSAHQLASEHATWRRRVAGRECRDPRRRRSLADRDRVAPANYSFRKRCLRIRDWIRLTWSRCPLLRIASWGPPGMATLTTRSRLASVPRPRRMTLVG